MPLTLQTRLNLRLSIDNAEDPEPKDSPYNEVMCYYLFCCKHDRTGPQFISALKKLYPEYRDVTMNDVMRAWWEACKPKNINMMLIRC